MTDVRSFCGGVVTPGGMRVLCRVCDLELDRIPARQHFLGRRHREACLDEDERNYVCFQCGIWCNSEHNLQQHYDGWAHGVRLDWLDEDPDQRADCGGQVAAEPQRYWSEGSEAEYSSRYSSEAAAQPAADGPPAGSVQCRLCNVSGTSWEAFDHFTGDAHRLRALDLDNEGFFTCCECGCFCPDLDNLLDVHRPGAKH